MRRGASAVTTLRWTFTTWFRPVSVSRPLMASMICWTGAFNGTSWPPMSRFTISDWAA